MRFLKNGNRTFISFQNIRSSAFILRSLYIKSRSTPAFYVLLHHFDQLVSKLSAKYGLFFTLFSWLNGGNYMRIKE